MTNTTPRLRRLGWAERPNWPQCCFMRGIAVFGAIQVILPFYVDSLLLLDVSLDLFQEDGLSQLPVLHANTTAAAAGQGLTWEGGRGWSGTARERVGKGDIYAGGGRGRERIIELSSKPSFRSLELILLPSLMSILATPAGVQTSAAGFGALPTSWPLDV